MIVLPFYSLFLNNVHLFRFYPWLCYIKNGMHFPTWSTIASVLRHYIQRYKQSLFVSALVSQSFWIRANVWSKFQGGTIIHWKLLIWICFTVFRPRVYPTGSLVIALVRQSIGISMFVSPPLSQRLLIIFFWNIAWSWGL